MLQRNRLVTLTGVAGVGKSRLAVETALGLGAFRRTVIDVSSLSSAADLDDACEMVRRCGEGALLLLDNCEQLLEPCADLAGQALEHDGVRVLVTSRAPLGLEGEAVREVLPLPVVEEQDGSGGGPGAVGAVRLFLDRAGDAGRARAPGHGTGWSDVVEICRRLDGVPLAIELAAAWVPVLSAAEILARLDDVFDFLVDQDGHRPPRHRSMGAALQSSYDLLAPAEAALLRRLSVFAGGATLGAVEEICAGGEVTSRHVLRLLARLARQSVLLTDDTASGTRYRLPGSLRSFARRQLVESAESLDTHRRHLGWCTQIAERPDHAHLAAESENLRSALDWCTGNGHGQEVLLVAVALASHWRVRGDLTEGRRRLESALAVSGDAPGELRARALNGLAYFTFMLGERTAGFRMVQESLGLSQSSGDLPTQARALNLRGFFLTFDDDPSAAIAPLEESAAMAREAASDRLVAESLVTLGRAHMLCGRTDTARRCWKESLEWVEEGQDGPTTAHALIGLGWAALERGDYLEADRSLKKAVGTAGRTGDRFATVAARCFLGERALQRGSVDDAERNFGEALLAARALGSPFPLSRCLIGLARLAQYRDELDAAAALYEEAASMAVATGMHGQVAWCRLGLADVLLAAGDLVHARRIFEEVLATGRPGSPRPKARALHGLALCCRLLGDVRGGKRRHREALLMRVEVDAWPGIADSLEGLAGMAVAEGRHGHAARLFGAGQALRDAWQLARPRPMARMYEPDVDASREGLGEEQFARHWARGSALPVHDAVSLALSGRVGGGAAMGWNGLTSAERRVVRLVEEGLTNREIGGRLFVSPRTVSTHLSHVFAKLGVSSRVELASEASRRRVALGPAREYVT
ncbi:MAG: tetratricopeptide repeat protein [Actinomycetota bacterium]|nr:tetratricopeptide repeat protein [Actinomycetota bacterium]